jgi:hypothetical protein
MRLVSRPCFAILALSLGFCAPALAQAPAFSEVTRAYQHGVFGQDYEFARLDAFGQSLRLAEPEVFEDRRPRLVDLNRDGQPEILAVVSQAGQGAGLALFGLDANGRLARLASGPKIGQGHRWQAPVIGQADIDGDGIDEVASILTPHIRPRLQISSWQGDQLQIVSTRDLPAGSNHAYASLTLDNAQWCQTNSGVSLAWTQDPSRQTAWYIAGDLRATGALAISRKLRGDRGQMLAALGCR